MRKIPKFKTSSNTYHLFYHATFYHATNIFIQFDEMCIVTLVTAKCTKYEFFTGIPWTIVTDKYPDHQFGNIYSGLM